MQKHGEVARTKDSLAHSLSQASPLVLMSPLSTRMHKLPSRSVQLLHNNSTRNMQLSDQCLQFESSEWLPGPMGKTVYIYLAQ